MSIRLPNLALPALALASSLALGACGPEKRDDSDSDTSTGGSASTGDDSTADGSSTGPEPGPEPAEVCRPACEHFDECTGESSVDECMETCLGTSQFLADMGGMCDRFYLNWVECRGELACDVLLDDESAACDEASAGLEYCAIE